jgi:hypothetical protein
MAKILQWQQFINTTIRIHQCQMVSCCTITIHAHQKHKAQCHTLSQYVFIRNRMLHCHTIAIRIHHKRKILQCYTITTHAHQTKCGNATPYRNTASSETEYRNVMQSQFVFIRNVTVSSQTEQHIYAKQ